MFSSKPASHGGETGLTDDEIEDAVDDITDIVAWEDAGFPTDWTAYSLETKQLYRLWRSTEADVEEERRRRFDALVKSFLK